MALAEISSEGTKETEAVRAILMEVEAMAQKEAEVQEVVAREKATASASLAAKPAVVLQWVALVVWDMDYASRS